MHPRNIYQNKSRAIALAEESDFLKKFVKTDSRGRKKLELNDKGALEELSKILLKEDFNLIVEFPPDSLVPTIPSRLNYIHWIEDIINLIYGEQSSYKDKSIHGIDIGTGGSAIYALLGAKLNNWLMVGTDIHKESLAYAQKNVGLNSLENNIKIAEGSVENLFGFLNDSSFDSIYDFCMCNPPFFDRNNCQTNTKRRKKARPAPSNVTTGRHYELSTEGGEEKFILAMINESISCKDRIKVFTTLVGIKKHLSKFIEELTSLGIKNFCTTKFQQGKTWRWGLAWSFSDSFTLKPTTSS